jgi:hypothetical protein
MATPMTADQFLAALKAEGVKVSEHAGWRTHNRSGHGGWGPMNGVLIHHTAGVAPGDGSVVWSGRSDLPGPLAHGYLAKDGTVTMTANGRANHAGGGSAAVLSSVVAERMPLPATHYHEGSSGAVDGNAHFYGLEISNLGTAKDPYPTAQYEAAVRWAAAICRHHGWSANSVIGHKEWSDWKSDPSFDMTGFRTHVAACLAARPGAWGAVTAPSAPQEEDDMSISDDDARKIARQVVTGAAGMHSPDDRSVDWALSSYVQEIYRMVKQQEPTPVPEIDYAKLAAALIAALAPQKG